MEGSGYQPPRWLRDPHVATIWASRFAPAPTPPIRRERWDTPDGDFIDVDLVDGTASAPRVVVFHGLEGSSSSGYARALMDAVRARGWRGAAPNWRGCSGELNRLPRAYHSGDSAEMDFVLHRLADDAPLYVVGVSLGGNVLCKWLGERGERALVRGAVSVCAPVDLRACAIALEAGFSRVYAAWFMRTLKKTAMARHAKHGPIFDANALSRAKTLRAFDDVVTAPLHGFADADDYYARSSGKQFLKSVRKPLLLLNAVDDPFMPRAALPTAGELSTDVRAEFPQRGGHVGFVGAHGDLGWLPRRALSFFDSI
jgi:predicted alpha/beta-fold hydrolase